MRKKVNLIAEKMSCADRPRKEKELEEWGEHMIKMFGIYKNDGKEHTNCPLCGIDVKELIKEMERIKTEAKIEVLEEVLLKSSRYLVDVSPRVGYLMCDEKSYRYGWEDALRNIRGDLSKLKKGTKEKGNYPVKYDAEFVGELSKLKKKKK